MKRLTALTLIAMLAASAAPATGIDLDAIREHNIKDRAKGASPACVPTSVRPADYPEAAKTWPCKNFGKS